ncbi:MAG: lipopolysaccharide assembly protein LapB [Burkholderiaceae bacterium]
MFVDVWWFILLPILFGLGWFAARLDSRMERSSNEVPSAYFKGLNFLLNEQPDKAIDAFVDVVQLDPETTDVHFALGNLFRRRGENERAIRVHKNLVDRGDLDESQREHALFELGRDYLKAGLLDRAEDAFNRLEGSPYRAAALDQRLKIAQMVRDWPQAIDLAEQLDRQPGESHQSVVAHFYCEQAAAVAATADVKEQAVPVIAASELLARAIEADPAHIRALLMRGEFALAKGDAAGAITAWNRAFETAPRYAALVAADWLEAHRLEGSLPAGIKVLEVIQEKEPSVDVLGALYKAIIAQRGEAAAISYLTAALTRQPSLLGYHQLVVAKGQNSEVGQGTELELGRQMMSRQVDRLSRYLCGHCGFSAQRYYWQCPGCTRWDSYSPRRVEELDRD